MSLDRARSLSVATEAGTVSSEVSPISWKIEMIKLKPENLIVPLIKVSQFYMPNLFINLKDIDKILASDEKPVRNMTVPVLPYRHIAQA